MKIGFIGRNDLEGLKEDATFAREHGFEGLEFNYWAEFRDLSEDTVKQMRSILDEAGIECSALGLWGWNHISPQESERAQSLELLERAVEYGKILGAETLITGGGDIPDAPLEKKAAEFASVFPEYIGRAEKAGMKVALYAVHGGSFFTSIQAYEAAWEKVDSFGIKLDPANIMNHGDNPVAWLRDHGDKVAYVHIKEHLYMDGELASQPAAGMGDLPWGNIFAFLYEHGYDGWLSVEPHGPLWGRGELRKKMLLLSRRFVGQFLL